MVERQIDTILKVDRSLEQKKKDFLKYLDYTINWNIVHLKKETNSQIRVMIKNENELCEKIKRTFLKIYK